MCSFLHYSKGRCIVLPFVYIKSVSLISTFMVINITNEYWIVLCLLEKASLINCPISNSWWVRKDLIKIEGWILIGSVRVLCDSMLELDMSLNGLWWRSGSRWAGDSIQLYPSFRGLIPTKFQYNTKYYLSEKCMTKSVLSSTLLFSVAEEQWNFFKGRHIGWLINQLSLAITV